MSERVDVLAVIDREISIWAGRMSSRHTRVRWPQANEEHAKWMSARAAVTELIEADREYDAANLAVQSFDACGLVHEDVDAAYDRLCTLAERAANRRAAALARVGAAP